MSEIILKQSQRLYIFIIEIFLLCLFSYLAFDQWIPPLGIKGFWFYTAILCLLLGSRLITPFFHKPADVISYSIPALVALFLSNNWAMWNPDEKIIFILAVVYCSITAVASFLAILTKDSNKETIFKFSNSLRVSVDILGSPKAIFSFVMLFALYVFHRESPKELIWIFTAWLVTIALSPVEMLFKLFFKLKLLWAPGFPVEIIGTVVAYQNPGIILVRQTTSESPAFNKLVLINDPHSIGRIALILDYIGRDEGILLRGILLQASLTEDVNPKAFMNLQGNVVIQIDQTNIKSENIRTTTILNEIAALVGIVAPDTSIERLYFEVIKEEGLEEGRLVKTFIGNKPVLYQIVNGLTKEEIVHQKNTHGYARAQAQKIGIWDASENRFKVAPWLPKLNTPVFLQEEKEFEYNADAIGHFPKTNYAVRLKNIHDLVTHNTAILGILGVGKSMLSIELVERMISTGIKVVCLDLTNQYANELSSFYNSDYEEKKIAKFAMRTFDETGKEFLSNYIGRDYASVLSSLPERQAVLFGKASSCENPVLIRLNDREKFKETFRAIYPPPTLPEVAEEIINNNGEDNQSETLEPF